MKVAAFIPARSGSTRLKNKNIKKLLHYPLFFWTVKSCIESKKFDKIIFSSDSEKYYTILKKYLKKNFNKKKIPEIIFDKRSEKESGTKVKIFDYLKNNFLKKNYLNKEDMLVLMLPTTPLRSLKTIRNSIKIAKKHFRNVFTVTQYDFHVSFAINIKKKMTWKPLFPKSPVVTGNTQSQNQKTYFYPTDAVDCIWLKNLKKMNTVYHGGLCYLCPKIESIDIDTIEDFNLCQKILKR